MTVNDCALIVVPCALSPVPPEVLYGEERNLVDSHQIIPLFHLPEIYALSARVKNWNPARTGKLRLEEIWLEGLAEKP